MSRDPELWSALREATVEELQPIIQLLDEKSLDWSASSDWCLADLREQIHEELLLNGGNTLVNTVRGYGPPWREIVQDVASKLKVAYCVDEMSSKQRAELSVALKAAGIPTNVPIGAFALRSGLIAAKLGGFTTYQVLVVVANAVARTLVGHGISFAGNMAFTQALSVALGPIGWAAAGIVSVISISGAATRVTIPSVVLVAALRATLEERQRPVSPLKKLLDRMAERFRKLRQRKGAA
jgi:uncharacterized protein YaaW (UPF0174 family)